MLAPLPACAGALTPEILGEKDLAAADSISRLESLVARCVQQAWHPRRQRLAECVAGLKALGARPVALAIILFCALDAAVYGAGYVLYEA